MQTVRPLSVAVLALAVVTAGAAAASASTATPAHAHPASHPRTDAVTVPVQNLTHFSHLLNAHRSVTANQTSTNWAGYAANGSTFTTVTSSWIEPSVSCTANGIAAFWIGLDGYGSSTVEQDGTGVDCSSGSPQPFAWWETYPANSVQEYGDPVAPGDSITSTVTSSGGEYDMVLTDNTRGWTENNPVSPPSGASNASAEIVAEAVTSGSSVTPLPDFGSVTFTGNSMNNASLQSANAVAIDMTNGQGGPVIASTGPLSGSGDFTVSYGSGGGGGGGNSVSVNSPGSQSSTVGTPVSLQISASDSGGASLTYSASGLPAGLSINSGSGLISGTPSAAGTYNPTVKATDSTGATGSASFTWTVSGSGGGGGGGGGCSGLSAWSATTAYAPGDVVSYNGHKYTSTWYSTGAVPSDPGSWAVWQDNGAC